ncbi:alpha/beta-hydrolase [Artomyces pyxidatus]|uniref:Alpha/beta-hydrolase n=1 Tax=Artomyces pyxidatus TaxID=48021 RepID=A0ACB8SWY9_9AGAM|nr:alpha/beta-hydrolase [Artomyces pyxidatus]
MTTEQPFKIDVSDAKIEHLKRKLELTDFPDELDEAGLDYGAPLADIKRLIQRWADGYDWRVHEAKLNEMPMFTRDIEVDGFGALNIHYVHQKSDTKTAIPLLFVHGWPGSIMEVQKILPLLTASSPDFPSFHVVAPSLPGFGFSEGPHKKGFHGKHYVEVLNKLMISLGYPEYVTQGGDWGHFLTRILSFAHGPKHVKASHTNFAVAPPPTFLQAPRQYIAHLLTPYTPEELAGLARSVESRSMGLGYAGIQTTRPQTLGYGLADSPAGLLAWVYEKLLVWSDDYPWQDDEVLTWLSIYWFSRAGPAASLRIYYELARTGEFGGKLPVASIPIGVSYFPKEIVLAPHTWIRATGNVVFEARHPSGGHFAAHEKPEFLVGDVRAMFGKGGPVAGIVPGHSGYAPA